MATWPTDGYQLPPRLGWSGCWHKMRACQVNVHREWRDGMSFHFCDKIRSGSNWRMKYRGGDRRRNTHTHTNTRFVKARHSPLNDVINTEQTDPILISLMIYRPESPVSSALYRLQQNWLRLSPPFTSFFNSNLWREWAKDKRKRVSGGGGQ